MELNKKKSIQNFSQCHSLLLADKKTVAAKQQKIGGINLTTEIHLFESETSKSKTRSLVSSVPFLDPTAQTSLVALARILQTTPPLPPLSSATRSRINSPEKIMNKQSVKNNKIIFTWNHSSFIITFFSYKDLASLIRIDSVFKQEKLPSPTGTHCTIG